ncbi:MAG: hypothetical protein NT106_15230 [Candidatus Sumerlaeota bacterium]|nr:hypothetical protein [Candidatus Sumerlaeota bacterium]
MSNIDLLEKIFLDIKLFDKEDWFFIGPKLVCPECNNEFAILRDFVGVITCPYCGEYVEG